MEQYNVAKLKYKINKYQNKINILQNGGNLPFLDDSDCSYIDQCPIHNFGECKRTALLKKCLPLYNIFHSGINIYVKDNNVTYPLHYSEKDNKSYIMNHKFSLSPMLDKYTGQPSIEINDFHTNYFNYEIKFNETHIPYLYLLLKKTDIFDIYLAHTEHGKSPKNNIFRSTTIQKTDSSTGMYYHRFVAMSISWNIFNLSLFTHTFFEVMELFHKLFTDSSIDISQELGKIYQNYNLNNLYQIIKYTKAIKTLNKLYVNDVMNSDYKNYSFPQNQKIGEESKKLEKYERGSEETQEKIITEIKNEIKKLSNQLKEISLAIGCDDYKYIFLMSILGYRLENPYVTGMWKFSQELILKQITKRLIPSENYKSLNTLYLQTSDFPPIYEYSTVVYNKKSIGDCMENVIFQLLKLLFWDKRHKTYRINDIISKINNKYSLRLSELFVDIKNENTSEHATARFKLFTIQNISLDFIQGIFELNPTLKNLIIVLEELFRKEKPLVFTQETTTEYLNDIINYVENKDIGVNSIIINDNSDIIDISTDKEIMTIELQHRQHAFFKNAVSPDSKNKFNIFQTIRQDSMPIIMSDLEDNKYRSYYEFSDHILLTNIIYQNKNSKWMDYLAHVHMFPSYMCVFIKSILFSDVMRNKSVICLFYNYLKNNNIEDKKIYYCILRYGKNKIVNNIECGFDFIIYLIEKCIDFGQKNEQSINIIMPFVRDRNTNVIRYLVERPGVNMEFKNLYINSFLVEYGKQTNWDMVKYLIMNGADPNHTSGKSELLISIATKQQNWNIIRFLIDHNTDPNSTNQAGNSIMAIIGNKGNWDLVKYLIQKINHPNLDGIDESGATLLTSSAYQKKWDIMEYLIKKNPDPNIPDKHGAYPITIAADKKNWGIVKLLLGKGADPKSIHSNGKSLQSMAIKQGNKEIIDLLKQK